MCGKPDFRELEQFCVQFVLIFRDGKRRGLGEIQRRRLIIKRSSKDGRTPHFPWRKKGLRGTFTSGMNEWEEVHGKALSFFLRSGMGGIFYIPITQAKGKGKCTSKKCAFCARALHLPFPNNRNKECEFEYITCRRQVCTSSGKASKLMAQMKVMREARTYRMLECWNYL